MRSTTTLLQALFATSALAIQITHPKKNDVVDVAGGVTVQWNTVNTDPQTAHLVLVNMASGHTPYSKDLGEVDLTKGSIIISEKDVPNDSAFQFNFQSVASGSTGILAQSEQFEVKNSEEKEDDKKETKTDGSKTTAAATLVTASQSSAATASASESDSEESSSSAVSVSGASTLATVTGSATSTASGTASATAAPTGAAGKVQSGSLLALAVGIAAVLA
ncbi:hypothetical protein B0T20DRAFT_153941 [Sordaria brevicollis]|uniref:Yeast cell wall synthesis Kre9/Knh1-like N-terminal domain-containing protein n=1 Tax=Sordaria brevicollis TaxID=83679 RepID=A0AAE0PIZ9_SORBR|nr:hypothetical protein B0T20DRAFT_153941 [Sordaria brevicollis]